MYVLCVREQEETDGSAVFKQAMICQDIYVT
jgi:hypothetical protein